MATATSNTPRPATLLGLTFTRHAPTALYQARALRRCATCGAAITPGTVHTEDAHARPICTRCEPLYGRPPHANGGPCSHGHLGFWGDGRRARCRDCGSVWMDGQPGA